MSHDHDDISCQEALRSVYEYLDGELDEHDAACVEHHFEICQQCYPHLRFTAAFRDALHRAAEHQESAPAGLRAKIATLLEDEGAEGAENRV